jgi:hypothetical protein
VSDKLWRALAESECENPKTGNGDCEKETGRFFWAKENPPVGAGFLVTGSG